MKNGLHVLVYTEKKNFLATPLVSKGSSAPNEGDWRDEVTVMSTAQFCTASRSLVSDIHRHEMLRTVHIALTELY